MAETTDAILAEVRKNKDIIREEMEKGEDKIQKKVQEILQVETMVAGLKSTFSSWLCL